MANYWMLAAVAASLASCRDYVQPLGESAFAENYAATLVSPGKPEMTPAVSVNASAPTADEEQIFYDLSDDPNSLQLLALDTIEKSGANTSVLVIDLFRGRLPTGLMTTWQIDCGRSRMTVIRAMAFKPGESGQDRKLETKEIGTQDSPKSRQIAQLACNGNGQLEKEKVYRGKLPEIIKKFWG